MFRSIVAVVLFILLQAFKPPTKFALSLAAATKARIKAAEEDRSLSSYRVVHFATHGLISGEIAGLLEPALVLTPLAMMKLLADPSRRE